jgi:hypothetical protein
VFFNLIKSSMHDVEIDDDEDEEDNHEIEKDTEY